MNKDQVLLVDKPSNMTSFGVVARIRRKMTENARARGWTGKRLKVGHTGTLDPFATGLMIILTGAETKSASEYSKLDKVYEATIVLGKVSTTGDSEGNITKIDAAKRPSNEELNGALRSFVGEISQTPPVYSAIKIDGERAYKLVRQGKIPQMPTRKVKIYDIELISYSYPELVIRAHVSSGTYIRTLAEDIGKKLNTGAYTSELRRIKVGKYDVEDAKTLARFGIMD